MEYAFVIEPETYHAFGDEGEQIEKCKEWGLLSDKATKTKTFYYKGHGLTEACAIVGYVDRMIAVIEFDNKRKHCIHPAYLKEMQASSFGQRYASAAESDAETAGETPVREEAAEAAAASDATDASEADQAPPWDETDSPDAAAASAPAAKPAASEPAAAASADKPAASGKSAKSKSTKIQLPEDKVKMIATVQAFTTVPNHFTDSEDEVVIYEAVSITDSATELGTAWSSHSATIKKLELAVGDTITFEAKVIAKKLTKHPVPYKINNPSKITKEQA